MVIKGIDGMGQGSPARPTFASPRRYNQWIRPLKPMERKQMPHDLACFATRYLVEEAVARNMPMARLCQDIPEWMTLDYLVGTSNQVSHGVFIALAERLKEYVGNPDPWFIGEVAQRAAAFDDPVTNIVRRWGTVSGAIKFTTFLGKFVTKDQVVDARETGIEKGRKTGRTIHYFLNGQEGIYYEQTTATIGYYQSLTRLWPISPQPNFMQVEHALSRFSPEQLLMDVYYYALKGSEFERDREGNFRINGEVYARPVEPNKLQEEWHFDGNKVTGKPHPVRMVRHLEHDGKIILPEGLILDAPASVYVWSYDRLPPVNRFRAGIEGFRQRFGGRKYVNEIVGQVEAERDRAEERRQEAERQREEAERQRGIAEERAERIAYAAWAAGHLLEGAGSQSADHLALLIPNLEEAVRALREVGEKLAQHPDTDLRQTANDIAGYVKDTALPGLSQIEMVLQMTRATFGPVNHLFTRSYEKLKRDSIDVKAIAEELAGLFQRDIQYTGKTYTIQVQCPDAPVVVVGYDRGLIYAYLFNLINNATWSVRQRQPVDGGQIRITLEDNAHGVQITVADNGLGLPATNFDSYLEGTISSGKGMNSKSLGTKSAKEIADYYGFGRKVESVVRDGFTITTALSREARHNHGG